jgi:hypothetical protein
VETPRTEPSAETREAERDEASTPAQPDDMPTPDEEQAAERAGRPADDVREHYEEMARRGARQKGEGRIP